VQQALWLHLAAQVLKLTIPFFVFFKLNDSPPNLCWRSIDLNILTDFKLCATERKQHNYKPKKGKKDGFLLHGIVG
jgi:hypothetical protein